EHPFLINDGIWVEAGKLQVRDTLWSGGGINRALIDSISIVDSIETVYNIHLNSIHTYWVSEAKVVVHNPNPAGESSAGKGDKKWGDTKSSEHKKGARKSTEQKHQQGQTRKNADRQGHKGMTQPPRKKPDGWKGPWP